MQSVKRATKGTVNTPNVHLRYDFAPTEQPGAVLDNPLFEVLAAMLEHGSIRRAAESLGVSYRHLWGSLHKWEKLLGEPLIHWSQGQRARPTGFAERLVWAERRARIRMQPHIEALRADLSHLLAEARDERHQLLSVRASHDLALPLLQRQAAHSADLHLEIGFQGSVDALRALNERQCVIAGFHVPTLAAAAPVFAESLKPLLQPDSHVLIGCSHRIQGLMMRKEHAGSVRSLSDVTRLKLRFAARQPGSGTRMLIEHLCQQESITPTMLFGGKPEHFENTHVAVALCLASGVADAGIGVEAAALEYGLHFLPLAEEQYFLACLSENIAKPAVLRLREVLAGAQWRGILAGLRGYQPARAPGELLSPKSVLPWWA